MNRFVAGDRNATVFDVAALGLPDARIVLSDGARARIARSREIVTAYLESERPSYGLNTGLGGNLGYKVDRAAIGAFQEQVILGRNIGVGAHLPREVCRAALACRIISAAKGMTGLSQGTVDALLALHERGVTPALPTHGSIGASDIGLNAHLAAVLIGRGQAWVGERLLPGAEALAAAGLSPSVLEPKDGIGLCNTNCVSAALASVTLSGLANALLSGTAVAALAFEGYAGNPQIFDARIHAAHPSAGQVEAAALFRALLEGSSIHDAPRKIQDAVSFRALAPAFGAAIAAFAQARAETEADLNGVQDTPMILLDEGVMLSSPSFHTAAMSLAHDAMAIAVAQLATASAHRMIKLMNPILSELPKYLSPVGGPSAGYVSTQKLAASLQAEIKLHATPASIDAIAVSDTVEDIAPQTMLAVRKLATQLVPFRYLTALEGLVAAQAVDLREGLKPGTDGARLHAAIRDRVPMLQEDREPGPDVMAVDEVLADPAVLAPLGARAHALNLPLR